MGLLVGLRQANEKFRIRIHYQFRITDSDYCTYHAVDRFSKPCNMGKNHEVREGGKLDTVFRKRDNGLFIS